ncbi:MAG: NifB/NifX family molybdenum-iron cluster-binding protein [Terriglobia bacterium]|nr:NifB/NifX family molybdenum-iron cluster-binding protein [Terriglobia bacterium]
MKLVVTSEGDSLQSPVDPRFGRAKFFVVIDTETHAVTAIQNAVNLSATQGAGIQAGKTIVELGVQSLITGHVGPKAFATLQAGNVVVYTGATGTAADAVEQLNNGQLQRAQSADVEGHH